MSLKLLILTLLPSLISAIDYCQLCENGTHTMCKYKNGPAQTCIDYKKVELTSGDKKYIVNIHNDIRNHVASGQESRGTLGSQPPAADMYMLQWDNELSEIAQRWADQCIQINETRQHDICKRTERFEVGQNILTAITTDIALPELSVLILNWYKQVVNVIPSDVDYFIGIRRGKFLIGQYTQLVWAETKYVGCGMALFKESNSTNEENDLYHHRLVCNYGPTGNIIGQMVYQRGAPCSKCPTGECDSVRTNLCRDLKKNKDYIKEIPFTKKGATTQTNISIFNDNTKLFNTKVNSSLCLNPDELNNMTNTNYTKCIIGIGSDKTNGTAFNSSTKTSTSSMKKKGKSLNYTPITSVSENTVQYNITVNKSAFQEVNKIEKIILLTTETNPENKDNIYGLANGTFKVHDYKHHHHYSKKAKEKYFRQCLCL